MATTTTMTASTVSTGPTPVRGGGGGGGGNNRRGRGGHGKKGQNNNGANNRGPNPNRQQGKSAVTVSATVNAAAEGAENGQVGEGEQDTDEDVCWICAEPVKYYSLSECNHRTCHVCALRLRALYKKLECAFCKESQKTVIFTTSPSASFLSFDLSAIPHKDAKLSIYFETQEMMEETLVLLRFNCPDPECDHIATAGWGGLKMHVRERHGKVICDLCIRSKKVFAHEHALYTHAQLAQHLPSMLGHRQKQTNAKGKDAIEGGIHPLCEFCRECFFGDDELFAHMRERHEECFVCKRAGVLHQYFNDYPQLERHFTTSHHACTQPACLAQKFVVFGSMIDFQAHMVEAHGSDMTARDMKDARRVQADFEFEEVGHGGGRGRGGPGRGGSGAQGGRGDRDRQEQQHRPPPRQQQQPPPPPNPGPSRPPGAGPPVGGGGRRREAFGAGLTSSGDNATPPGPSRGGSPLPRADVDPAILEQHAHFISRLQHLAPNPVNAVPVVKAAIRGYRLSETSARDMITTIWNVMDCELESTASVVNGLIELLGDDGRESQEKKDEVLESWKTFELEQRRQFPELIPTAVGSGYAGIASGRVLNAKQSTNTRQKSAGRRQVWERVADAASGTAVPHPSYRNVPGAVGPSTSTSTQSFPSLGSGGNSRQSTVKTTTPWSSGGARAAPVAPVSISFNGGGSGSSSKNGNRGGANTGPPPKLSNALFPELPSTGNQRVKVPIGGNKSLNNILGMKAPPPTGAVWSAAGGTGTPPNEQTNEGAGEETGQEQSQSQSATSGKKGKGKGKQKQTLFTTSFTPV